MSIKNLNKFFFLKALFLLLGMFFLMFFRFHKWQAQGFWGDDLSSLISFFHGTFSSTLSQALSGTFALKYRPIYQLFNFVEFSLFKKQVHFYMYMNYFLQMLNGIIFFAVGMKLSKNKFFIVALLSFLFISSRFALFQLSLVIGPVESLALIFFQLAILFFLKSLENERFILWNICSLLMIALSTYTHERYIVVAFWSILAFSILQTDRVSLNQRFMLVCGYLFIILSNLFIKKYLLHLPVLVGTGGTNIKFNLPEIIQHSKEFYLSLFGFNYGPSYLIGISIIPLRLFRNFDENCMYFLSALFFILSFLAILIINLYFSTKSKKNIKILIFAILLIFLFSIPPIMTIRVEGRWEYTGYLILLYIVAWCAGLSSSRNVNNLLSIIFFVTMFALDGYIASSFGSIYLTGWTRIGGVIKNEILPIYEKSRKENLILEIEDESLKVTLMNNKFFEFYSGFKKNVIYVSNDQELNQYKKIQPDFYAFKYDNNFHFNKV